MNHPSLEAAFPVIALSCGLIAAVTDIRSRRIPNLLTAPALLAGLALHALADGWKGFAGSFEALLLCGAVFLLFYLAGAMGAGDVKLIAAEGCLLGLSNTAALLTFTAIAGGVLAVFVAWKHGRLREMTSNVGTLMSHHSQRGLTPHPELNVLNASTLRLPYAIAIVAGVAGTLYLQPSSGLPW